MFFLYFDKTRLFYFQKFIQESDKTDSGAVSLADFIHYVREHEKNLKLHFSHLDKNRDGKFLIYVIDKFLLTTSKKKKKSYIFNIWFQIKTTFLNVEE